MSKDAIFKIRPLKWDKSKCPEWESHRAEVPMGSYTVRRIREDWDESKPWEGWQMIYLFDEYHDEGEISCNSLADGKEKAWKDWLNRITPALVEQKQQKEKP
jgi:hypothetical protein